MSSEPHAVIRSAEKIRSSYDDDFVVNLAVRGRVMMTQQRFDAVLQPGDFAVYDSALPCQIACPDPFRQIVLKIPRDMYTAHCLLPGGGPAAVVRGDHGVGALFGKPLWQATEGMWRDLGSVTVDADLGALVVAGVSNEVGERDLTEVIRQRDEVLVKLLKLKSEQNALP